MFSYTIVEAKGIISKFLLPTKKSLNVNYSKQYNDLQEYFQKVIHAETHISAKTCMHHIWFDTEIATCDHCGKQVDIYSFSNQKSKRFCGLNCKYAYNNTNHVSDLFTDYTQLLDLNGNLSQSKISKLLNKNSIEHLQNISTIKTTDLKTLLYAQLYGTEKLKYCEECGVLINVRWCSSTPYTENTHFCSNECRNKNKNYKDNIAKQKLGIKRNNSDSYRNNVSGPWFAEKIKKILDLENITIDCSYEDYLKNDSETKYRCVCNNCNHSFNYTFVNKIPFCPKCNLYSKPQRKLVDFINSLRYTDLLINDRSIIAPYELDIVIPELQIAIEYDGLYFHRNKNDFHKYTLCKEKGIRLIKIFDDESETLIKSRLKSILNKTDKIIFGRKCKVIELNATEAAIFLNENHIQGYVPSSLKYGLKYDDELVAVMTFGRSRYNKNFEWELLRFANKANCSVVGGASKLFQHFIKTQSPQSVLSYCDVRWGSGNMYEKLGFKFHEHTKCNYFWYKGKRESRIKYQKHKLLSLFPNADMSKTEDEIMYSQGFSKIYDFGNYVYHWRKD